MTTSVVRGPLTGQPERNGRVTAPGRIRGLSLPMVYGLALAFWIVTRGVVLIHQGAWPWMNAFVVAAARGIVVGDWNEAVRPQLPAVLGVPLVLAGATEQQAVAALYLIASLVQFGAFLTFVRALYPRRATEQGLALLLFVIVPFNHSIHHYRDVPVVLASSAVFLLAAQFVRLSGPGTRLGDVPLRVRDVAIIAGALLLGIFSRTEVLTFVAGLVLLALLVWRRPALRLVAPFVAAAAVVSLALLVVYRLEGVDPREAARYQAHTFLDSTPDSWLTPECRGAPTENCRERDGLLYFGPADLYAGVLPMVAAHPLLTVAKTVRSAIDNLWILFGPNLSTFPAIVPFAALAFVLVGACRSALRQVPWAAWMVAVAVIGETVLPPLSWAPPHPQYHLQLVLPVIIVLVPLLLALASRPRGRLACWALVVGTAALSAVRYTRYPGD